MDINKINFMGSLSDDAAKDLLAPQLAKLSQDFPEHVQELMRDWIDGQVRQLWDHTSDIPKADVRLRSLSMMLAKKVDKARELIKILSRHDQDNNLALIIELISTL